MQLKKFIQKDRHGNMMHIEFEPEANVPPMQQIPMPMYDHPGEPKGTDTVPAWLTPGENVINAEASRLPGVQPMLDNLNNIGRGIQEQQGGSIPAYADKGGQVQNNKLRIYNHLKNKWALNNNQIAAVMGQIGHETGNTFDYKMLEKNVDANVRGEGLFQNTPGSNRMLEPYLKYLNKNEISNSPESQIDFFMDSFMTKGAVPREDDKTTKENEASPWYHGSKKADRMREAFTNPDLRLNVNFKDDKPSLVGELTRFINVPGESLAKRNDSTIAMTNWIDQYGMKVIPGAPNDKGQLFEPGSTTSFPGEENYESTINDEPGFVDKLKGAYNTIKKFKLEEGGKIPEVVYADHGYPHWLSPSTWNKQHWQGKGNLYRGDDPFLSQSDDEFTVVPEIKDNSIPKFENITKEDKSPLGKLYTEENGIPELDGIAKPPEKKKIEVPELDGIAPKPDYTGEDRSLTEIVFPKTYESRPQFSGQMTNQRGKPNKVQQAAQAFANDKETKDTFFNDLIISPTGEPQSVNKHRISEEKKNQIEETFIKNKNREMYNRQMEEFNTAVMQDKARKAWEVKQERIKKEQEAADKAAKIQELENQKTPDNNSLNKKIDAKIKELKNKDNVTNEDDKKIELSKEQNAKIMKAFLNNNEPTPENNSNESSDVVKAKVNEAGNNASQKEKNNAEFTLKGFFGDLFDTKELKRAAIIYLGSRLLGSSHNGSLKYVAKSYLDRVDSKSAARSKWIRDNATKYNKESLQLYAETGDWSVLVPKGQLARPTGKRKDYFDATGNRQSAREFKIKMPSGDDATFWSYDGGKSRVPDSHHQDAKSVRGTDEYMDEVRKSVPGVKNVIKEVTQRIDETITKTDTLGSKKKTYITKILAEGESYNVAKWARDNGFTEEMLGGQIMGAYELAIQDSVKRGIEASTLIPYLEQMLIRNNAGVPGLTKEQIVMPNKEVVTYTLDNDKFMGMNKEVLDMILPGNKNPKQQKEALQSFYAQLSTTFMADPKRMEYVKNTTEGYTPFGLYLQHAIEINKIRLANLNAKQ